MYKHVTGQYIYCEKVYTTETLGLIIYTPNFTRVKGAMLIFILQPRVSSRDALDRPLSLLGPKGRGKEVTGQGELAGFKV